MSSKEQIKLEIVSKVFTGQMRKTDATKVLNVSPRTMTRYLSGYRKRGVMFVKHGNYNKEPVNKLSRNLEKQIKKLVLEKYYDFNMSHCIEKLIEIEKITVKRETFRRMCHEINMVKKSKRRRKSKARYRRDASEQTGIMIQFDGSPHRWFGGKESCLIAGIDDADKDVPWGEFFNSEDTISCMRVLQKIIEKKGIFHILYTDKAGLFGGTKRSNFSQVKRALLELGIHIIYANSPEAKGRIERLWGTLQDRLIPEMRLRNIRTFGAANDFLQEQFLPNDYKIKFTVPPRNLQTAYRPLPSHIDLNEIFCIKEQRTVNADHTVSWNGDLYKLISPVKYSIYKQKIEIRTYQNLTWKAFFAGKQIKLTLVTQGNLKLCG